VVARSNRAAPTTKRMVDGLLLSTIALSGPGPLAALVLEPSALTAKAVGSFASDPQEPRLVVLKWMEASPEKNAHIFVVDETRLATSRS
jgi:hypothetical protein